jgi:hypothetical protein
MGGIFFEIGIYQPNLELNGLFRAFIEWKGEFSSNYSRVGAVATKDRVFPYYVPNSSIKHNKSDSKDRSQEILWSIKQV